MVLVIGYAAMLDKIERRLLAIHIGVFLSVLSILAIVVFAYFKHSIYAEARRELSTLADSIISSIDFDEVGRHDAGIPDAIVNALPLKSSESLINMRLQWFNPARRLMAQRGQLIISVPFIKNGEFQEQSHPHALVLTRSAILNGKIFGYVRVAHPLESTDEVLRQLLTGLIFGIIISAATSTFGITLLVRQSMVPILEMIRRLKQFTADASHELSNPLMAIQSNSRVALKYSDGMRETDKEKFEAIVDASNQMARLTEVLLRMAQLENRSNGYSELAESINISEICQKEIDKQLDLHGDTLTIKNLLPDLLICIAEKADIEALFCNVLANAFQYTSPGDTITVEGKRENGSIVVSIKDTGIGISSGDLLHIFDRFWRADEARNHRDRGNGLGLAIVKTVVEKYNGTISVQSQVNVGSEFTVCLPTS